MDHPEEDSSFGVLQHLVVPVDASSWLPTRD